MRKPTLYKLELGKEYYVIFKYGNAVKCKLIRSSPKGYNFLNIKTNCCIFKRGMYPSKYENHLSELWFFIYYDVKIQDVN